jgi:hypothetical protein
MISEETLLKAARLAWWPLALLLAVAALAFAAGRVTAWWWV